MRKQLYWHGIPVPYIALWSSEEYSHLAPDKNAADYPSIFLSGTRGEGEPVWGKMHETRQRETVATCRCQVCNCKLRGESMAYAMDVPQTMRDGKTDRPLLLEPPVCRRCVAITLKMCPGNKRRAESGELQCFQVYEWTPVAQILQGTADGGTPALNAVLKPGETCVGLLKYALRVYRRLDWDELLREVGVAV